MSRSIIEFEENSSFPCKSTEDLQDDKSGPPEVGSFSAGSEIIAKINLRRPSVPNLRNINNDRQRPTSGITKQLFHTKSSILIAC